MPWLRSAAGGNCCCWPSTATPAWQPLRAACWQAAQWSMEGTRCVTSTCLLSWTSSWPRSQRWAVLLCYFGVLRQHLLEGAQDVWICGCGCDVRQAWWAQVLVGLHWRAACWQAALWSMGLTRCVTLNLPAFLDKFVAKKPKVRGVLLFLLSVVVGG